MDKKELFKKFFINREDLKIPILDSKNKFNHVKCDDLDNAFTAHLEGVSRSTKPTEYYKGGTKNIIPIRVGAYALSERSTCKWKCIDFDGAGSGHKEPLKDPLGVMLEVYKKLIAEGISADSIYIEKSASNTGYHIWIFFEEAIPAMEAKSFAESFLPGKVDVIKKDGRVISVPGKKGIEVFPKQTHISEEGLGNFVWLPWWDGVIGSGNQFHRLLVDGRLELFEPEDFSTIDPKKIIKKTPKNHQNDERNKEDTSKKESGDVESINCEVLRTLIKKAQNKEHLNNDERVRLGQILIGLGKNDDDIIKFFCDQQNFNLEKTKKSLKSLREGHKIPSCKNLSQDLGICDGKCPAISEIPRAWSPLHLLENQRNELTLPRIMLSERQFRDIINDCKPAILRMNIPEPKIFRRNGKIVALSEDKLQIELVDLAKMYGFLTRAADFFIIKVLRSGERIIAPTSNLNDKIARDLLSLPDNTLPEIKFITTSPFFNEDGELIIKSGFHRKEKIYLNLDPDLKDLKVPKDPTPSQVEEAKSFLIKEVFVDFPFTKKSGLAHVLSVLLGFHLRGNISGPMPLYLFQGSGPGVGKGLIVAVISFGTLGYVIQPTTISHGEAELKKVITSVLIGGRGFILLDNAQDTNKIDSPSLASVITSRTWTDRLLGVSSMVSIPNDSIWVITGNNVLLSNELSRRCINVYLDPKIDQPWLRPSDNFRHPDLLEFLKKNKEKYFESILTLIRYWFSIGKPKGDKVLGSFEEWSKVIGGLLDAIGVVGFLEDLQDFYSGSDSEGVDWREFVGAWWKKYHGEPQTISELNSFCNSQGLLLDSRGHGNERSQQTKLGMTLKRLINKVFNFIGPQGDTVGIKLAEDRGKHGKLYQLVELKSGRSETSPVGPLTGPQIQKEEWERELGDKGGP